jgi:hypothetical protein
MSHSPTLITTCDPQHFHLLRPFVNHYRSYGVQRFIINLHFDIHYAPNTFDSYRSLAEKELSEIGLTLHSVYACPFDAMAIRRHHDRLQSTINSKWFISADIDEFHEYPDSVANVINFMESNGQDYMCGGLVDRLARTGFPPFEAGSSLWKQFPLGTDLTRSILRGWVDKVMLSRAGLRLMPGHHRLHPGQTALAFPGAQPVHHFKWDISVVERLRRRLEEDWKQRCRWWTESERVLEWMHDRSSQLFAGLRVYDFMDDTSSESGPLSRNPRYLRNRSAI